MNWMLYTILLYPIIYIVHAFITLVFFLCIMRLQEIRDSGQLITPLKEIAAFILVLGYGVDFTFNLNSSVPFLELPKEFLFSARVSRLAKTTGWRSKMAQWICTNFLNRGDPSGCHCK